MSPINLEKAEKKAILSVKMRTFCKSMGITIDQFMILLGVSRSTWFRILNGLEVEFETIVKIVENSHKTFKYQDFEEIFLKNEVINV